MLQSLSTMSPPFRFGQAPLSRSTSSVNFGIAWSGQPACLASDGSQDTSPWRNLMGWIGSSLSAIGGCQSGCNAFIASLVWAGAEAAWAMPRLMVSVASVAMIAESMRIVVLSYVQE